MSEKLPVEMKSVEKIVNMDKYTEKGKEIIREGYAIIEKMDKGLNKDEITILANFFDEHLFEAFGILRAKEASMHGIKW